LVNGLTNAAYFLKLLENNVKSAKKRNILTDIPDGTLEEKRSWLLGPLTLPRRFVLQGHGGPLDPVADAAGAAARQQWLDEHYTEDEIDDLNNGRPLVPRLERIQNFLEYVEDEFEADPDYRQGFKGGRGHALKVEFNADGSQNKVWELTKHKKTTRNYTLLSISTLLASEFMLFLILTGNLVSVFNIIPVALFLAVSLFSALHVRNHTSAGPYGSWASILTWTGFAAGMASVMFGFFSAGIFITGKSLPMPGLPGALIAAGISAGLLVFAAWARSSARQYVHMTDIQRKTERDSTPYKIADTAYTTLKVILAAGLALLFVGSLAAISDKVFFGGGATAGLGLTAYIQYISLFPY
jgi:hypothetical protein